MSKRESAREREEGTETEDNVNRKYDKHYSNVDTCVSSGKSFSYQLSPLNMINAINTSYETGSMDFIYTNNLSFTCPQVKALCRTFGT